MTQPTPPQSLVRKIATKIANEPVVVLTTTIAGGIAWLFGNDSFLPHVTDATQTTITSIVAFLVSVAARQFVTPTRK